MSQTDQHLKPNSTQSWLVEFTTVASLGGIHIIGIPLITLASHKVNTSQKKIISYNEATLVYHLDTQK